jgi:hypothetical protein
VSVRPELGPTLPSLLAARGVSRRAMLLGLVGLAVLAVVVVLAARALSDTQQLTVAGPPQFNFVYDEGVLHTAQAHAGELARLEGRRPRVQVAISARRFDTPAYEGGDLIGGYLPILAEERKAQLRAEYGPIEIHDEGKARFGDHTGYQIGFSAQTPDGPLFGRDAYVLPADSDAREGVLLSLRRVLHGRQRPADEEFSKTARLAYGSFNFGEDRP